MEARYLHPGSLSGGAPSSPAPSSLSSASHSHYGFPSPALSAATQSPQHSPSLPAHQQHPAKYPLRNQSYFDARPNLAPSPSAHPHPAYGAAQGFPGPSAGYVQPQQQYYAPATRGARAPPPPAPVFAAAAPAAAGMQLHRVDREREYLQHQQIHQRVDSDEVEQLRLHHHHQIHKPRSSSRGAPMHARPPPPMHLDAMPPLPNSPAGSTFSASTTFTFPTPPASLPPTPSSASFSHHGSISPPPRSVTSPPPRTSSARPPAPPAAPVVLGPPFALADWQDAAVPEVVSPALYLSWQESPLAQRRQFETVFVDAEQRRVGFVARQYRRGRDGVLRKEADDGAASGGGIGFVWPEWHDGLGSAEGVEESARGEEGTEWLLLEVPSAKQRARGEDQLRKIGLVTEETLFLQQGKKIRWSRFYKRALFGSGEPSWKGVGGGKYRWVKEKRDDVYKLVDDKTKEVVVSVREQDDKPTQLIVSALVLPSLQPILLTLLHRNFALAKKKLNADQREWEEEEVVAW
ncbi:uncharacterized protein JCM10292_003604 [Rhodotorula paludigena]|uniref:uncharacterized protein n=1 Tax=Rhodotorula paludigena TaxID=86838 RepID=UPI00317DB5DA